MPRQEAAVKYFVANRLTISGHVDEKKTGMTRIDKSPRGSFRDTRCRKYDKAGQQKGQEDAREQGTS
jgi:hypothetical protein